MTDANQVDRLSKRLFIARFLELPAAHAILGMIKTESPGADMDQLMEHAQSHVTKWDFFNLKHNGGGLLTSRKGWEHFNKVAAFFAEQGEPVKADDFNRPAIDSMVENDAIQTVFDPEFWRGRVDEARKLYFSIPAGTRNNKFPYDDFIAFKRDTLALDQITMREDRLNEYGIDWKKLPDLFSEGKGEKRLKALAGQLRRHGDFLTKEDLFLTDKHGENMFFYPDAWDHFNKIAFHIRKGGQEFNAQDFLHSEGSAPSLLQRAQEKGKLSAISTSAVWGDRLDEMVELWATMPKALRYDLDTQAFLKIVDKAENRLFGGLLDLNRIEGNDLFTPLAIYNDTHIYPLGISNTWSQKDALREAVRKSGGLKLTDLQKKSGFTGRTVFEVALDSGHLEDALALLIENGQKIQPRMLLKKDEMGLTPLDKIAERGELATLFASDLWIGQARAMKTVWSRVPIAHKGQVNWSKTLNEVNLKTFLSKTKTGSGPRRRPKP